MNAWQLAQQVKAELAAVTWPDGARDVVFGDLGVFVYAGAQPDPGAIPSGFPFALVAIGDGIPDEDEPGLIVQTFEVAIAAEVTGDPHGEFAVIGGSRQNLGKSAGAGVAELEERVRAALQSLTGADGAAVVVSGAGTGAPAVVEQGRNFAFSAFRLSAVCTSAPVYAAPQAFRRDANILKWNGAHCAQRFDFLQYRVGYVAGSTPAASPADFDATVYTGTAQEAAVTLGYGRTYSVFADYDPRGTGSVAKSSEAVVGSYFST